VNWYSPSRGRSIQLSCNKSRYEIAFYCLSKLNDLEGIIVKFFIVANPTFLGNTKFCKVHLLRCKTIDNPKHKTVFMNFCEIGRSEDTANE
jgi:hypothetical protein